MATAMQISVAEYLSTAYRPDCDYLDGQVRERNLGEYEHARPQGLIVTLPMVYLKRKMECSERRIPTSPYR